MLDYQPLFGKMSPHSSPRKSSLRGGSKTGPGRRRKSSLYRAIKKQNTKTKTRPKGKQKKEKKRKTGSARNQTLDVLCARLFHYHYAMWNTL